MPYKTTTLRSVIFTRLLMLVGSAVLALALGFALFGLQPLHDRLAAKEFARVADGVRNALQQTITVPASLLAPITTLVAQLPVALDEQGEIERLFKAPLQHLPNLSSVVLGTEDGRGWTLIHFQDGSWLSRITDRSNWEDMHLLIRERADGQRSERIESLRYDPRKRPWYTGAVQRAEAAPHWTAPYSFFTTGDPGITTSQRFRLADGTLAVLGFDIMLRDLSTITQKARIGTSGRTLVLTEDERVLGLPRRPENVSEAEWLGSLLLPVNALGLDSVNKALSAWRQAGRTGFSVQRIESEGRTWLAAMHEHRLGERRLWVLALAPAAEFAPAWSRIALGIAVALAALMLLASAVARRVAQRIAAPLEALATNGKRIGNLDFSATVPLSTHIDEIAQLDRVLEDMRSRLAHNQASLDNQSGRLQAQVEELRAAEQRIHALAYYDPLTQLPNRRLMMDRLHHAIASSQRRGVHGALLLLDLDNFKTLNDTLGHDHGDRLLREVADRLAHSVRKCDTVARLGGDEFVVVLEDLDADPAAARSEVEAIGQKILQAVEHAYRHGHFETRVSASIGAMLFGSADDSVEALLKYADMAMYRSKASGRNCMHYFGADMAQALEDKSRLEADLRAALTTAQLSLHYQPQVDAAGQLVGAEALLRWTHPVRGPVSPGEFIPIAEESGLIIELGAWVLEAACVQLAAWARDTRLPPIEIAVNVSARQFRHQDFTATVADIVTRTGIPAHRLKLELTESLLLEDVESAIARMHALQALGVGFALDDFGTGYSSLTYLKRLPLANLKIDQSFVRDVMIDPNDAAIARTVIALGRTMELTVIAEGVEQAAQFDFLVGAGCDRFQGYFFGRPEPAAALTRRLLQQPG
ncbi:MAG: EAL domain-containing protein [Thauera sp.]